MFLTRDIRSPIFAGPITGREFILGGGTLVPCPERLAPFRIRFLDLHVRITKTNDLLFAVLASLNHELLRPVVRPSWFVALHLRLIDSHPIYLFIPGGQSCSGQTQWVSVAN